ncbi:fibro-slime domain-containing protein [Terrisporobacter sp.]
MKQLKKLVAIMLSLAMIVTTVFVGHGSNSYAAEDDATITLPLTIHDAHMDGFIFENWRSRAFGETNTGLNRGLVESTLDANKKIVYKDTAVLGLAKNIKSALDKNKLDIRIQGESGTFQSYPNYTTLFNALRNKVNHNSSSNNYTLGDEQSTNGKDLTKFENIETCYDAALWMTYYLYRDGGDFSAGGHSGTFTKDEKYYENLVLKKQSDGSYSFSATTANEGVLYDRANKSIENNTSQTTRRGFYPLDNLGFGNEDRNHNYAYTLESSGKFVYHQNEKLYFDFKGDDDVYLFINGKLALDIGGQHSQEPGVVKLEDPYNNNQTWAQYLGLEEGKIYDFNFFYMERHTTESNMSIKSNIRVYDAAAVPQKNAYVGNDKLPYGGLVAQGTTVNYEFVLNNTSDVTVNDLTFVDNTIGVSLSKDAINLGSKTKIGDLTVKIDGKQGYESYKSVTEQELKDLLAEGISQGQTIRIKGFKYTLGDSQVLNTLTYTAKAGDKTLTNTAQNLIKPVKSADKAYVIDYGKPVTYSYANAFAEAIKSAEGSKNHVISLQNKNGNYGTMSNNTTPRTITYTLNKFMSGVDVFRFDHAITSEDKDTKQEYTTELQTTVKMVPASSIYYEDNFADEDGNTLINYGEGWKVLGSDKIPEVNGNGNLGYDSAYDMSDSELEYSGGTIHYVPKSTKSVKADFTFTGQGIDLYSYTSGATGKLTFRVFDESGTRVLNKTINTKYNSGEAYQVPVVTFMGEKSQTYKVEITVPKNEAFYLDAIRIYNSVKIDKDEVGVDNEADAKFVSIREESLKPTLFSVTGDVFIDAYTGNLAKVVTIPDKLGEYTTYGRKTEVVLAPNSSITITLSDLNKKYSKVELGARIDASVPSNITGGSEDGKLDVNSSLISLKSSTDMYYTVSFNDQGQLVVTNNTNKLVSLTKLKLID